MPPPLSQYMRDDLKIGIFTPTESSQKRLLTCIINGCSQIPSRGYNNQKTMMFLTWTKLIHSSFGQSPKNGTKSGSKNYRFFVFRRFGQK